MADEPNIPAGEPVDPSEEEVSWEDAFQEAALGHAREKEPEGSDAPSIYGSGRGGGGLVAGSSRKKDSAVDMDFLLDISLNVTAEIGRTRMLINELLQLNQGSIITLDKQVGESIDVLVNGKLMARGEVVMVNEMFAIRLTEIIGPMERIQQLT
jgi:flagellar motor switch protein FliN/FliY